MMPRLWLGRRRRPCPARSHNERHAPVCEPTTRNSQTVASYKVAESDTFAYPVASGNRIYVKDLDSVILWTVD